MSAVSLDDKVAFLTQPETHGTAREVESVETHMSWVFLTSELVYKLKKPVRQDAFDFSTREARRLNCVTEVQLNRRLAEDVYLGVVPLTRDPDQGLSLGGGGEVEDWLVKMKRLPADSFLDRLMERGAAPEHLLEAAIDDLVAMYQRTPAERLTGAEYRQSLHYKIEAASLALLAPDYGLENDQIESIRSSLEAVMLQHPAMFDERVRAERIVECHGDLRPEHLCLTDPPRIIDCLEFNRALRIMDTADEVAFLAMESELADHYAVAERVLRAYRELARDHPEPALVSFYQARQALIRAMLVARHLDDEQPRDPAYWRERARQYLARAESLAEAALASPIIHARQGQ